MCVKNGHSLDRAIYSKWIEEFFRPLQICIWINLIPVTVSHKTSFNEWYAEPSRAPTFIWLPCCAILACSEVRTWDENFVIQMKPWISNFLFWVISSRKSSVGTREARQWACPRFISVFCELHRRRILWSSKLAQNGRTRVDVHTHCSRYTAHRFENRRCTNAKSLRANATAQRTTGTRPRTIPH